MTDINLCQFFQIPVNWWFSLDL